MYQYIFLGIIIGIVIYYIIQSFNNYYCPSNDYITETLVRQSSRWLVASQQDKSPLISLLHSLYGFGYFMALKEIMDENTINRFVNTKKFEKELNNTLDITTKKVVSVCPQYANELNNYFGKLAKDL
jgi:hypothetical protein